MSMHATLYSLIVSIQNSTNFKYTSSVQQCETLLTANTLHLTWVQYIYFHVKVVANILHVVAYSKIYSILFHPHSAFHNHANTSMHSNIIPSLSNRNATKWQPMYSPLPFPPPPHPTLFLSLLLASPASINSVATTESIRDRALASLLYLVYTPNVHPESLCDVNENGIIFSKLLDLPIGHPLEGKSPKFRMCGI